MLKLKLPEINTSINYETKRNLYELKHFFDLLKLAQEHVDRIIQIQRTYKTYVLDKLINYADQPILNDIYVKIPKILLLMNQSKLLIRLILFHARY